MPLTYTSILFDLDGTLLDSLPVIIRAFRETHEQMGLPFDEAALRRELGIPLRTQAVMFAGERSGEFVRRYTPIYRGYQEAIGAKLFPGTCEMLGTLKRHGYRLALVTSKSAGGVGIVLSMTGIGDYFDIVVTADDVANHKPHPEPIVKALDLMGVESADSLYVGDSLFDVESARQAWMDVSVMSWGARSREDLLAVCPGRVFDDWPQFLASLGVGG